jgi:hypothetical protein
MRKLLAEFSNSGKRISERQHQSGKMSSIDEAGAYIEPGLGQCELYTIPFEKLNLKMAL